MAAGGSKSKKTATIIDVARLAGVSQQTVSRVANGSNLVREATRAKVQAAMKELGYSPNRQARALRNGRSKMIGLVINYHRNNVLSDLLEGITSTAAKLGYGIVIVPAGEDIEEILLRQSGYIASLNLAGLIVFSDEDISESSADHVGHLPTVVLGSLRTFPNEWSFVDTQGSRISELAVEHLLGLGHKTVHHISGPLFSPAAVTRVEYWQRTLQRMVRLSQSQWSPLIGFLMMVIGLRVNCSTDILTVRRFMRLMMPSQVVLWRYVRNEAWWLDGMSA